MVRYVMLQPQQDWYCYNRNKHCYNRNKIDIEREMHVAVVAVSNIKPRFDKK